MTGARCPGDRRCSGDAMGHLPIDVAVSQALTERAVSRMRAAMQLRPRETQGSRREGGYVLMKHLKASFRAVDRLWSDPPPWRIARVGCMGSNIDGANERRIRTELEYSHARCLCRT